jgi:signal peptidase II
LDRAQANLTTGRVLFLLVAATVFVLDRVTKNLIVGNVPYGTEYSAVDHLVWITNIHNSGAAFGVVPAGTAFFALASIVVSIGIVVYVARTPGGVWRDAVLGLILGGAAGNGFDRLVHGTVTDFITVHWWPVFNMADSAVSVGIVLLVAGYLIRKPAAA